MVASVELRDKPAIADVLNAITSFRGLPQERQLPSAPARPLIYLEQADRPQPRRMPRATTACQCSSAVCVSVLCST